jgi:hypothetical protein
MNITFVDKLDAENQKRTNAKFTVCTEWQRLTPMRNSIRKYFDWFSSRILKNLILWYSLDSDNTGRR